MRFLTSFGMTAQKRSQTRRGLQVPMNLAGSVMPRLSDSLNNPCHSERNAVKRGNSK